MQIRQHPVAEVELDHAAIQDGNPLNCRPSMIGGAAARAEDDRRRASGSGGRPGGEGQASMAAMKKHADGRSWEDAETYPAERNRGG